MQHWTTFIHQQQHSQLVAVEALLQSVTQEGSRELIVHHRNIFFEINPIKSMAFFPLFFTKTCIHLTRSMICLMVCRRMMPELF